jgi:hypothetical protein
VSDPYDDDILLWSVRQAALLRRRAAGELVNDAEIDWTNVTEEIEDVGRSQLNAVGRSGRSPNRWRATPTPAARAGAMPRDPR